jgi:hypothetical protein
VSEGPRCGNDEFDQLIQQHRAAQSGHQQRKDMRLCTLIVVSEAQRHEAEIASERASTTHSWSFTWQ